ncbi:hypothetical protein GGH13_007474, partial [Coemansia sp. S155-1]
ILIQWVVDESANTAEPWWTKSIPPNSRPLCREYPHSVRLSPSSHECRIFCQLRWSRLLDAKI